MPGRKLRNALEDGSKNASNGSSNSRMLVMATALMISVTLNFLNNPLKCYTSMAVVNKTSTAVRQEPQHNTTSDLSVSAANKTTPLQSSDQQAPTTNDDDDDKEGGPSHAFEKFLDQFDVTSLHNWTHGEYERFYEGVQEFHYQEPLVPINEQCLPQPLPSPAEVQCDSDAFGGRRTGAPAKIGHSIQFGIDVDTLEIHLQELYDVVDKFFIVEMVRQHNQVFPSKQLTWDKVKKQARFEKFRDKIVHFTLDDLDAEKMKVKTGTGMWSAEAYQEIRRWEIIDEWNSITGFFSDTDVIGFGDTDEIASRFNVQKFKFCQFKSPAVDVGIWFPYGRIDQAFRPDYPVRGHKFTLGDPTFWTFASAKQAAASNPPRTPSRNRGTSGAHLVGGMHMSHYGYLPYILIKGTAASEYTGAFGHFEKTIRELYKAKQSNTLAQLNDAWSLTDPRLQRRIFKLSTLPTREIENIVYFPWFYDCNRDRYPHWEGKMDTRMGFV